MPVRVKSMVSGRGYLGTEGHLFHGAPYEEQTTQEGDFNGQPFFEKVTSLKDVITEHFNSLGAELDHPLLIERIEGDGLPTVSGIEQLLDPDGIQYRLERWVPPELELILTWLRYPDAEDLKEDFPWPVWLQHLELSDQLVPLTTLFARTNPGVPELDMPSFLWEGLSQLPSMIFNRGASLLGLAGDINLKWEFGWKPLLSDVKTMIDFGSSVSKKLKMIQWLIKGRYRSATLIEKHSSTDTSIYPIDVTGLLPDGASELLVEVRKSTKLERWGTVTYCLKPDEVERFRRLSAEDRVWKAQQAAFGLYWTNPAALWEVLPWSWFVDWFVPIQDLLSTYQGLIPVEAVSVNVMTYTRTDFVFRSTGVKDFDIDIPASFWRETKERQVLAPDGSLPEIKGGYPTVDSRKLGILASIRSKKVR